MRRHRAHEFIIRHALEGGRAKALLFTGLRQLVLKLHDPLVRYRIGDRVLQLPFSHQLPFFRTWNPTYSDNLSRLCRFVRREQGVLRMIDVGANIGDSFFLAGPQPTDRFLLVEGDAPTFELLRLNTAGEPTVSSVRALLSDHTHVSNEAAIADHDTAHRMLAGGAAVQFRALDDVVSDHPELAGCNLLKTDVEGWDGRVLAGAAGLIRSARPVIFFEHFPEALDEAGEDDEHLFGELERQGYSHLLFYDNVGYLLGSAESSSRGTIRDLVLYVRQLRRYLDVCAFHESQTEACERFLDEERRFYATSRLASPLRGVGKAFGRSL